MAKSNPPRQVDVALTPEQLKDMATHVAGLDAYASVNNTSEMAAVGLGQKYQTTPVAPFGWATCPDIAKAYGVSAEALRARLRRWRTEATSAYWRDGAGDSTDYEYHVATVFPIVQELKQASAKRPPK